MKPINDETKARLISFFKDLESGKSPTGEPPLDDFVLLPKTYDIWSQKLYHRFLRFVGFRRAGIETVDTMEFVRRVALGQVKRRYEDK